MNEREFLGKIKDLGVLTIPDVSHIIGKDRRYAALYMKRLNDRGVVNRIKKGKYALPDTDPLVVATNLVIPSYISFLSGLAYHHKTTQIPITIQVATTISRKAINYESRITFVRLDRKRLFGYKRKKIGNGYAFIGEIEKVIVDSLFMPKYCPLSETMDGFDGVDPGKILNYALKMDSIVTLKRLGYLLELNGVDAYGKIKSHINERYDLLNPLLPPAGKNNPKWRIKVNEVL
jgi:predicted transcriptional regulator of viral defense system